MSRTVDDILDDCLERLAKGEGVDECASRYPEHRAELLPLLQAAAATMQAASSVSYRPEAKARGLARLIAAAAERQAPRPHFMAWLNWRPRLARPLVAGLVAALLTTGMAVGTGVASSDSVPGEPLYWVKTTKENVSLMVPRSDMDRAKLHISLARNRGDEMRQLMARGRYDDAEPMVKRIRHHLSESTEFVGVLTPPNPVEMPRRRAMLEDGQSVAELRIILRRDGRHLRAKIREQLRKLPPGERRKRLDMLRRRAELGYWALIASLAETDSQTWRPLWRTEHSRPRGR